MEYHRVFLVYHCSNGVFICRRKGVFAMIKTIIVCLLSFLIGYVTPPYDTTETDKEIRILQSFAIAAAIATVITLALM